MNMTEDWCQIPSKQVLEKLNSHRSGLTAEEAGKRLLKYGPNVLQEKKKISPVIVFLRQFLSPLIYVLFVAAVVSLATSHILDASVIFGVLILNAVIGYVQESRAEKAMDALLKMTRPKARVVRDGSVRQLPTADIVPGDIIVLETGDIVPADARLLEISSLKVNEAMLTGESMPVDKHTADIPQEVCLADRRNLVYMGTIVTYGRATAVITGTGAATEIGKIAGAISEIKREPTPLQKSIQKLSRYIVIAIIVILAVLVISGILRGLSLLDTFFLAVAAAVSAIPEGLPAVLTVVLAVGMQIMARRNAIIRKLAAVETLGSTTVICSDKTGTLTLNEMTVRRIFIDGKHIEVSGRGYNPEGEFLRSGDPLNPVEHKDLLFHLRLAALCNDALLTCDNEYCNIYGDPTEGALVVAAAKAGMNKEDLEREFPRIDEIPFQSENRYMATLHPNTSGGRTAYIKGSVERILEYSSYVLHDDRVEKLTGENIDEIMKANEEMAGSAMRVIATAYIELPSETANLTEETVKSNLIFVGLLGMEDPPRPEAIEAVQICTQAGIKVVMITGDNSLTAQSVARQLGIPSGRTITGNELQKMSEEELISSINNISVFARIEPLHKLRIVNAFKNMGQTVAMTGDGVNDAPALKSSNIGIAMGITGTDVAKQASDMVLADDNFASVVSAIDEGRAIFNRLRNVIFFLLSTNFGELLALILCVGFIGIAPLLAIQIIWVNLVTDTACGIPLGMEPKTGKELRQPPRDPRVGLLYPGLFLRIIFMAVLMGTGIYLVFNWAQANMGLDEARTLAFCTMVVFEWFRAFNARSDELPLYKVGFLKNRWLLMTISGAIVLQLCVVYVPFMQTAFSTVPIGPERWAIAISAGGSMFVIEEVRKMLLPNMFNLGKWKPAGSRHYNKSAE